jgi:S-adenosylmethionine:tRNA ribosyltransferase-isomerase
MEQSHLMTELDQYDYDLPRELIAQQPLPNRSDARLLVVNRQTQEISHSYVRDLPEFLNRGDLLVLNDTKVIPARLVGRRERTGGRWTGLYLESDETGIWHVMGKTRGKLEAGETIVLEGTDKKLDGKLLLIAPLENGEWAAVPEPQEEPLAFLEKFGRVPLPPYIRDGEMTPEDRETYQTVYAAKPGAVAAPTAGLHFTKDLLKACYAKGAGQCSVTLHVGVGTFRPVTATRLEEHVMHEERVTVTSDAVRQIRDCRDAGGRVIAVGTTVVRALEAASAEGELQKFKGKTDLFIRPPYEFRSVDALLTNFHLPKSTLLILVRTFGGDELMRRAYDEAIRERYRFFSYGDAMLIV